MYLVEVLTVETAAHCVKTDRFRRYSVRMRENAEQNNSEYEHILRSSGSVVVVVIVIPVILLITVEVVEIVLRKIYSVFSSV